MKIYLGSDHQGFALKNKLAEYLAKRKTPAEDLGDRELKPDDDFPQFAAAAALKIIDDPEAKAILICGGGQGMAMAANRFRGVRAIVAASADDAFYGRNDNDANVLCLPARILNNPDEDAIWKNIVDTFLATEFANATRYIRRNRELDELA